MKAIYTTTGMYFEPYKPKYLQRILNARSIYSRTGRWGHFTPLTAYVMKNATEKWLVTYHCGRSWLAANCPEYTIEDMPKNQVLKVSSDFTLNADVIPNDVQSSAIQVVTANRFKTAFFNIPTGVGKTLMSVYLTSILGVKAWAMCYRTIVLDQWIRTLEKMSDFDIDRVRIVNSSKELLKMAMGDQDPDKYDFYLSTPMILTKFAEKHGLTLLNDVFNNLGIGVKYYDEAHRNVGNITKINGLTNVPRTYYLSADFTQAGEEKRRLYYKMFANVPLIRPTEDVLEERRYFIGVLARYNTHPSMAEGESVFTGYGFNHYRYMEYQITKPQFWITMEENLKATHAWDLQAGKRYRTLILCNLIEQVDLIQQRVIEMVTNIYAGDDIPVVTRYHSQISKEEKEIALETGQIIVSTYQSMGVGIDEQNIRYVHSLTPVNAIDDNQAAGRSRALADGADSFYFMYIDDGFEYVTRRVDERLNYLAKQKLKKIVSIKYS